MCFVHAQLRKDIKIKQVERKIKGIMTRKDVRYNAT